MAGCFYGAIKSIYTGAAIGTVKAAGGASALAERSITPCVTNAIYTGFECAKTGFQEGAIAGTTIGFCSIHYPSLTGQSLPDVEMEISLIPKVQIIDL